VEAEHQVEGSGRNTPGQHEKHQDDAKIIYLFFVCISCVSSVFHLCITFDIFCVSVVHHVCVCASVVFLYILCVTSLEKKRRAEVQRQQAMARLQNEMALKEQNSMTLELRAAVEEALSSWAISHFGGCLQGRREIYTESMVTEFLNHDLFVFICYIQIRLTR